MAGLLNCLRWLIHSKSFFRPKLPDSWWYLPGLLQQPTVCYTCRETRQSPSGALRSLVAEGICKGEISSAGKRMLWLRQPNVRPCSCSIAHRGLAVSCINILMSFFSGSWSEVKACGWGREVSLSPLSLILFLCDSVCHSIVLLYGLPCPCSHPRSFLLQKVSSPSLCRVVWKGARAFIHLLM